jgi:hypothetical protein
MTDTADNGPGDNSNENVDLEAGDHVHHVAHRTSSSHVTGHYHDVNSLSSAAGKTHTASMDVIDEDLLLAKDSHVAAASMEIDQFKNFTSTASWKMAVSNIGFEEFRSDKVLVTLFI